jgi:hypothetical protein
VKIMFASTISIAMCLLIAYVVVDYNFSNNFLYNHFTYKTANNGGLRADRVWLFPSYEFGYLSTIFTYLFCYQAILKRSYIINCIAGAFVGFAAFAVGMFVSLVWLSVVYGIDAINIQNIWFVLRISLSLYAVFPILSGVSAAVLYKFAMRQLIERFLLPGSAS